MSALPKIIVACDTRWEWGRSFLRGIATFAEKHGPWDCDFTIVEPLSRADVARVNEADGLISRVNTRTAAAVVRRLKVPVVTIEEGNKVRLPNVCSDSQGIGKLAAEH